MTVRPMYIQFNTRGNTDIVDFDNRPRRREVVVQVLGD